MIEHWFCRLRIDSRGFFCDQIPTDLHEIKLTVTVYIQILVVLILQSDGLACLSNFRRKLSHFDRVTSDNETVFIVKLKI